jgi:SAM-dependent methyltransferase
MGIDLRQFGRSALEVPDLLRDVRRFRAALATKSPSSTWEFAPVLGDRHESAGATSGHYFLQDLWVARALWHARPERHLDVGSRLDGFVAHVLTFMAVDVVDIRPMGDVVDGLTFIQDDATTLSTFADASVGSVSCLHAVEHIGLGRYGDPVDPSGSERAMASLARILRPGGTLYFSVPVGRPRVEFNAHRVLDASEVVARFARLGLTLERFTLIDDRGALHEAAAPEDATGADYSCGIFVLAKH